jgi:hypothetical protein
LFQNPWPLQLAARNKFLKNADYWYLVKHAQNPHREAEVETFYRKNCVPLSFLSFI